MFMLQRRKPIILGISGKKEVTKLYMHDGSSLCLLVGNENYRAQHLNFSLIVVSLVAAPCSKRSILYHTT